MKARPGKKREAQIDGGGFRRVSRLLEVAYHCEVDLDVAIREKLAFNAERYVTNPGHLAGAEVIELYMQSDQPKVDRCIATGDGSRDCVWGDSAGGTFCREGRIQAWTWTAPHRCDGVFFV